MHLHTVENMDTIHTNSSLFLLDFVGPYIPYDSGWQRRASAAWWSQVTVDYRRKGQKGKIVTPGRGISTHVFFIQMFTPILKPLSKTPRIFRGSHKPHGILQMSRVADTLGTINGELVDYSA